MFFKKFKEGGEDNLKNENCFAKILLMQKIRVPACIFLTL